nr:hypothetical protein [Kibdelosporangium sp. MJ126-NF4]CTQ88171.1 hypothetical protein [Kibdelosporangium sp. MJ126-NF4]
MFFSGVLRFRTSHARGHAAGCTARRIATVTGIIPGAITAQPSSPR